jgi:hypothetical protein
MSSIAVAASLLISLSLSTPPPSSPLLSASYPPPLRSVSLPTPPPNGSPQRSEVQMFCARRPYGRRLSLCKFLFIVFL